MIGLEYIVRLYNGTYKKLAEKLGITPSTVTDWLSKRRPIPKAKLEALSKLFHLETEYFQKSYRKLKRSS
ncbi:helix-turn-helix transcriptional regulator [Paenibacillus sp. KS-LC4]|uniref:helix-turn-helix domain-containing protein n=1 Tax=Paenibacillus sp. KS-LC4 TaxID=2979727 RepID=UPI0030CD3B57